MEKYSSFNLITYNDNQEAVIFNTLNKKVLFLSKEEGQEIKDASLISSLSPELRNKLIKKGMIVDSLDEDKSVRLLLDKQDHPDYFYFLIFNTLQCNLRCEYCAQEHSKVTLDKSSYEAILKIIENKKPKRLRIDWYGGEPLMDFHSISSFMKKLSCSYGRENISSGIFTNGTLLTPKAVEKCLNIGIDRFLISLGSKKDDKNKKTYINGQNAFYHTLNNIHRLSLSPYPFKAVIKVFDDEDFNSLDSTFAALNHIIGNDHRFLISLFETPSKTKPKQEMALSNTSYALFNKYPSLNDERIMRLTKLSLSCPFKRRNSVMVSPTGEIIECIHKITFSAFGGLDNLEVYNKGKKNLPFCNNMSCPILPVCFGSRCVDESDLSCEEFITLQRNELKKLFIYKD